MQYEEKQLMKIIREEIVNECLLSNFESEVYDMINESLGVSNSITEFIYDNKQTLYDLITNSVKSGKPDKNGVSETISHIELPMFIDNFKSSERIKCRLFFTFRAQNFKSGEQFEKLKDQYATNEGWSTVDEKRCAFVTIYTYTINGKLQKQNFIDTLGHELSHVLKQSLSGQVIPKKWKHYMTASGNIASKDKITNGIAKAFYYGERFEQEGFANGLYYWFRENDIQVPTWETFKKSEQWHAYLDMQKTLDFLAANKEVVQKRLNTMYDGVRLDDLIGVTKTSMEDFKRRLIRILWKIHEELLSEGVRFHGKGIGRLLIF